MKLLSGAWPTMITPFNEDLSIDFGAYQAMIEWYLHHNVGGLYANCLSSEMYHLSPAERLQLVRTAVQTAGGRVPVAATGNLGATLDEQLASCRQMAEAGADVLMLVVPEHLDSESELEDYFMRFAEQVPAPLGLYECPYPRSVHLSVALVARLARSGCFIAFKETSCDSSKILAHLSAIRGTPLALLQANTPYMLAALRAGAPGAMTIAAIWLPEMVASVISLAQAGDPAADRLHARLCAMKLAQRSVHPLGTKYLLGLRGLPIAPRGRAVRELRAETQVAIDFAARTWFDSHGDLLPEPTTAV